VKDIVLTEEMLEDLELMGKVVQEAVAKEREEIAALVEDFDVEQHRGYYREDNGRETLQKLAAAIRARGTKP
jgi:hypothetical protein